MIPVATTAQMRECDRVTIEELRLPGLVLMEHASRAVAAQAARMLKDKPGGWIWIFCGKGNNGGDGFAAARHLSNVGYEIALFLLGSADDLTGDARFNRDLYRRIGGRIREIKGPDDLRFRGVRPDLVIDALLGTGFQGEVSGLYADAIHVISDLKAPVLSVDIPSGVECDSGSVMGPAVTADATVTFGLLKPGLLIPPGREYAGAVSVADIGIPPQVVVRRRIRLFVVEESDVRRVMPHRSPAAHKGDAGHVYILAGSPGLTGAAALSAEAAMRSGVGLAVVGVPASLNPVLEVKLTEAMTQPLPENSRGALAAEAFESILPRLQWADTVVLGPGLGRDLDTAALLGRLLGVIDKPLVIDADGLNLLADNPRLLKKLPPETVLTPHPGEFARLTGLNMSRILSNRVEEARRWAKKWGVTLTLKGSPSLTALTNGVVLLNSTGNAGMATGGSGDVLTGVIAALSAQGLPLQDAAWAGIYIHGAAGDRAADKKGEPGMIAGDIIDALPDTLKALL